VEAPSFVRRAVPLLVAVVILVTGWTWASRAPGPAFGPGTTRAVAPASTGPLRVAPGGFSVGGEAASSHSVYSSFGAMVDNAGNQPISIIAWKPVGASGLTLVGVELVPDADGAGAGTGFPGYPPALHSELIRAQPVGPRGNVVARRGPAQWLVVGYRLSNETVQIGTLHGLDLTYVVGHSTHHHHLVVVEPVQLCLHTRCNPDRAP
jgi:hypothetical protein